MLSEQRDEGKGKMVYRNPLAVEVVQGPGTPSPSRQLLVKRHLTCFPLASPLLPVSGSILRVCVAHFDSYLGKSRIGFHHGFVA